MTVELLHKVLKSLDDKSQIELYDGLQYRYEYRYIYKGTGYTIDLYRLVHLCKEFAKSEGYNIASGYDNEYGWFAFYGNDLTMNEDEYIIADTEAEAVFDVCQYILDRSQQ